MKATFLVILCFLLVASTSCKKVTGESMTVVKDCTGTYLRSNNKDYHVCNPEKIRSFPDGSIVTASYKKLTECKGSAMDMIVCMMYHENEGWIEVKDIR